MAVLSRVPKSRTVERPNQRWGRQKSITRGHYNDHTGAIDTTPAATLTAVSPATGPAAGGTAVTLTGTGFTGATGATFGGVAATAFSVVNVVEATCTTPAHAAGAVTVVVLSPNGNATKTTAFTYT